MAVLTLSSNNTNLSYLISKNPATGIQTKQFKSGILYGWYDEHISEKYHTVFIDDDNINSFASKDSSEYNYLDHSSITSAYCYLSIINKMFYSALKDKQQYNNVGIHEIELHTVFLINYDLSKKVCEIIFKNKSETCITELNSKIYKISIKNTVECKLNEFLENVVYFLFIVACKNNEPIFIDKGILSKYTKMTSLYDMPYHIRYILKNMMHIGLKANPEYLEELQKSETQKIVMYNDYIFNQRFNFIKDLLNSENTILDFGCGEGNYLELSKNCNYIGIDIDDNALNIANKKIEKKKYENAMVLHLNDFESYFNKSIIDEKVNILMTEILEHLEMNEVFPFLQKIQKTVKNINKIIITLPNKDFNKHFNIDNDFRHEDHKWEPNKEEFNTLCLLIENVFNIKRQYAIPKFDSVNDEPVTFVEVFVMENADEK